MDTQLDAELRANILVEALPYIQEYYGQTVVVKYGGNAMINEELKDAVIHDLVCLLYTSRRNGENRQRGSGDEQHEERRHAEAHDLSLIHISSSQVEPV